MKDYPYSYTIIIPHKNIPSLLQRCIKSIPQRKDIQIIVVDDGSNDVEELHVLEQKYRYVTFVYTTEGKGAGHARNVGLQYACGKWILFADADDFFAPNMFRTIDKYRNSDAEIVVFDIDSCDSETLIHSERGNIHKNYIIDAMNNNISQVELLALTVAPWAKLVSYQFISTYSLSFDATLYSNDVMWSKSLAAYANRILVSQDILYIVTTRDTSLTTVYDKSSVSIRYYACLRANNYLRARKRKEYEDVGIWYLSSISSVSQTMYIIYFLKSLFNGMIGSGKMIRKYYYHRYAKISCRYPYLYAIILLFIPLPKLRKLFQSFHISYERQ